MNRIQLRPAHFSRLTGLAALVALMAFLGLAREVMAHPLGNFTVNTYAEVQVFRDATRVRYIVDTAEIPTFQERSRIDLDDDGELSEAERASYLDGAAARLVGGLALTADGAPLDLAVRERTITFPEGEGGLATMRIELWFEAAAPASDGATEFTLRDSNYPDRLGWREIVVRPAEATPLDATLRTESLSDELRAYPADRLTEPLTMREVTFASDPRLGDVAPALTPSAETTEVAAADASASTKTSSRIDRLISPEQLTLPLVLLSLLAAAGFGALHALEPGHGKTLVAAYFVGSRGNARQAGMLGLIVAVTHTFGVFVIGGITLVGSAYILPEDMYPWLSIVSGLILAALGVNLLRPRLLRVFRSRLGSAATTHGEAHEHTHDHEHEHEHTHDHGHEHGHAHSHGPDGHTHVPASVDGAPPPWRALIALGLADGLVPTPSTLVVLVAAIALDRIALGLGLIAAFSVGFGAILTGLALTFVFARRLFERVGESRGWRPGARVAFLQSALPVGAGLILVSVGITLAARSLSATGVL